MYVDPFLAGIVATLMVEMFLLIAVAVYFNFKK